MGSMVLIEVMWGIFGRKFYVDYFVVVGMMFDCNINRDLKVVELLFFLYFLLKVVDLIVGELCQGYIFVFY